MKSRKSYMIALLLMAATQGAVAQNDNVTVKQGVEEADKWTANPNPAAAGAEVTVTYDGTLKVKSLQAKEVTPTDLSMVDCAGNERQSQWTANCYMVHTKGNYKLPLVYGNAIKNGAANTAAYTGVSGSYNTATFPRHDGQAINAPWIKDNGITVTQAELLWQDAKGLITEVGISGDYLTLTVGKDATEQEGNAVVAVKAGSTIVWSWHIWVTRQTFAAADLTTVATGSHNYQLTPVNVGWVGTPFGKGYSPYYQWGRKDAFIPAGITVVDMEQPEETPTNTGSDSGSSSGGQVHITVDVTIDPIGTIHYTNNHSVYDIDDKAVTGFTLDNSTSATIADNIKAPTTFRYKADKTSCNMWNAKTGSSANVSSATVKTVYDPCPPGFCVPTDNLYNYVVSADNKSNFGWNDDRKGFILKTSDAKVLFPALGKREDTEKAEEVDIDGYYWSATGFQDKNGKTAKALYIHRDNTRNNSSLTRVNGHPVRAVAEE